MKRPVRRRPPAQSGRPSVGRLVAALMTVLLLAPWAKCVAMDAERVSRWVAALAQVYQSPTHLPLAPADLNPGEGEQIRSGHVAQLMPRLGAVVGYKAALTTAAAQQRFGLTAPVYGFLLRDMLLGAGARIRAPPPLQPLVEADLVVRVGSAALNTASTPLEALAALDAVLPFIELPAMPYADAVTSAAAFVAANAGAWRGVLGSPVRLRADAASAARLRNFTVTLAAAGGRELGRGNGRQLMGDPLVVVLWLRDALRAEGIHMAPGDLLSLGSLTPPVPAPWGETVIATYSGLTDLPIALPVKLETGD